MGEDTQRWTEEGYILTETAVQLQAKGQCVFPRETIELGKGKERFLPEAFRRNMVLPTTCFQISGLQNHKTIDLLF
jgi:hypothetical protein